MALAIRLLVILSSLVVPSIALEAAEASLRSPEVGPDRRVTFRFRAPNAKDVQLALEGSDKRAMTKGPDGTWTLTTGPLEPDFYGYAFVADGVQLLDPSTPNLQPNLLERQSMVHVPGPASLPWEVADVPHGVVHRHFYRSALVGDDREFYVYTPPGYESDARVYPALYLLHGFSDDASAWIAVGRANVVLDNLIAQGKAKPMVVVMPLGYGAPEILAGSFGESGLRRRNMERFHQTLVQEVMPAIERAYRVAKDRGSRAIAGLSMGGAQALHAGLRDGQRFAWVGGFSSAVVDDLASTFVPTGSRPDDLRLLWIACGRQDRLMAVNRDLVAWLESKGIRHTAVETEGDHAWMVWRRNLATFAGLLFR